MRRLGLLALLAACEPPPDVEPLACVNEEPGVAELGVGDITTGWQPLEDGEQARVVLGPQGMHMVVVSLRVTDLEPPAAGGLGTEIRVALRLDGAVVGGTVNALEPTSTVPGISEFSGVRAVITVEEVSDLVGRLVDVEATVRDGCGRELPSARSWVLVQ